MRTKLLAAFAVTLAIGFAAGASTRSADAENRGQTVQALEAELVLLKAALQSSKAELGSRVGELEKNTQAIDRRLLDVERGTEAKWLNLLVR